MHSATSEAQFPTIQPHSSPPIFQPLAFCGVEALFFSLPVTFFFVLLGPWPRGKGTPGALPSTWSFTSNNLGKWKIGRLTVLLLGWWWLFVVLLFWWRLVVVIRDLLKVPGNS